MTTPPPRRLLLAVIDGLGRAALDRSLRQGHAPTLQLLIDHGAALSTGISPFPSLTPVCLSSIVTGEMPDRHLIPSLCWFHRGERRFVEYGSSIAASTVEGMLQTAEDSVLNLNLLHLSDQYSTLFEDVEDAGFSSASINYLVFRGRHRHTMKHGYGFVSRVGQRVGTHAVYGPERLYFGELYGHRRPILPQFGVKKPKDWSGAYIARWLVRSTSTDFTLLYLGDHDSAAHRWGPDETEQAVRTADRNLARVIDAAGGIERFVAEHALIVCADHGQTSVYSGHRERLEDAFADLSCFQGSRTSDIERCDIAIAPSNRFAAIYRLHDDAPPVRWLAERARVSPAIDIVAYAENGWLVVVNREGIELKARRVDSGLSAEWGSSAAHQWELAGDPAALDLTVNDAQIVWGDYPDALGRLESCLRCVNSGDVVASARVGWQFVDIGGKVHPGGSHGSLHRIDSEAPILTIGVDAPQTLAAEPGVGSLTDVAKMVREHFHLGVPVR